MFRNPKIDNLCEYILTCLQKFSVEIQAIMNRIKNKDDTPQYFKYIHL